MVALVFTRIENHEVEDHCRTAAGRTSPSQGGNRHRLRRLVPRSHHLLRRHLSPLGCVSGASAAAMRHAGDSQAWQSDAHSASHRSLRLQLARPERRCRLPPRRAARRHCNCIDPLLSWADHGGAWCTVASRAGRTVRKTQPPRNRVHDASPRAQHGLSKPAPPVGPATPQTENHEHHTRTDRSAATPADHHHPVGHRVHRATRQAAAQLRLDATPHCRPHGHQSQPRATDCDCPRLSGAAHGVGYGDRRREPPPKPENHERLRLAQHSPLRPASQRAIRHFTAVAEHGRLPPLSARIRHLHHGGRNGSPRQTPSKLTHTRPAGAAPNPASTQLENHDQDHRPTRNAGHHLWHCCHGI